MAWRPECVYSRTSGLNVLNMAQTRFWNFGYFVLIWIFLQSYLFSTVSSVPAGCNPNVDLVIAVDSSESIIDNDPYGKPLHNWYKVKSYLDGLIKELPVSVHHHRVALVRYSDQVHQEFLMDQYTSSDQIRLHIANKLKHLGGNTNTAGVLEWTRSYIESTKRPQSKSTLVIFTDGLSRNSTATSQQARELKDSGVKVFTVSLDNGNVDGDELYHTASSPQHRITAPAGPDPSAWEHSLNQAIYGICDLPVPTRDPFCDAILDVALIIDNSGSIRNDSDANQNYVLLKEFVKSLIDTLDITSNKTRVGAIRFSTSVHTEFQLDRYMDNREGMKKHIDDMYFEGLHTNISGALRQTRFDIFNSNHGDRPNIPNVAIVIADGESNVDVGDTRPQARLLKEENTRVYVVAIRTQKFDKKELEYIASDPDSDHYFVSPTVKNLPTLKCNLLKHVCQELHFDECV